MKKTCLILQPSESVFSSEQISKLNQKYEVIQKFGETELFNNTENKLILAIDPDTIGWNLDTKVLSRIRGLEEIHIPTTSFSWVDLEYCKKNNIVVTNVANYSTDSVAEFAIMMMLMIARKVPLIEQNGRLKDFTKTYIGQNLKRKKAGIIGLGNIGNKIAELCKNFGMDVVYYSKNSINQNFEKVSIEKLFIDSDYIFPCLASNDETKKLINDKLLLDLTESQAVISISDGYYNHEILLNKSQNNQIYGYAFDSENEVGEYKGNTLSLPHYAWYTQQSLQNNAEIWLNNIISGQYSAHRLA